MKLLRRFAVTLEYDGASFGGWQFQENAPTVQAALEQAITKRFRERRRVGGASRTDAGVHALGQVAIFDLAHPLPAERLVAALNATLPRTVRVLSAKPVPAGWDPRQSSTAKTYIYLIHNRPQDSPFWAGRAWQVLPPLALPRMRQAARVLLGRHDFSSFRATGCEAKHPFRTIRELRIERQGPMIRFRITADAFLYHMVRNIVGTLVEVGRGKLPAADLRAILAAKDRRRAGPTAPAAGLYLERITFGRRRRRGIAQDDCG